MGMTGQKAAVQGMSIAFGIVLMVMVVAAGILAVTSSNRQLPVQVYTTNSASKATSMSTSSITTSIECVITGQPGPFFLRVVWDSNQTPVAGARVEATAQPASVNGYPCSNPSTEDFTTAGNTKWYSLGTQNEAGYSITVSYSGQTYNFTAGLAPLSVTCASLSIPSGKPDVAIAGFQTTCPWQ